VSVGGCGLVLHSRGGKLMPKDHRARSPHLCF
jgi:hypothetical protein